MLCFGTMVVVGSRLTLVKEKARFFALELVK
jgi:hypothetical protein